jgi:hypothetical protein
VSIVAAARPSARQSVRHLAPSLLSLPLVGRQHPQRHSSSTKCKSRAHLTHHPPTGVVLFLFVVFIVASPPPAYGWLLCGGQMGSDIVDVVIASRSSCCHHHPHPHPLLIIVSPLEASQPRQCHHRHHRRWRPHHPTTAAEDISIEADKGG